MLTIAFLTFQDVNDERPVFVAPVYKAVISEAAEIGSVVPLHPPDLATDADSGSNGQVSIVTFLDPINLRRTCIRSPDRTVFNYPLRIRETNASLDD